MLNSRCVTPAAVKMTIFLFFFLFYFYFFFTLSTRKIGNRLSFMKIKFTFPLSFVLIVSAGRPLFDSSYMAFLVVEWVGKNTHYSLPHPLALFLLASLGSSPHSLNTWKRLFDILQVAVFTFYSEKVLHTFTFTLYIWDDGTQ